MWQRRPKRLMSAMGQLNFELATRELLVGVTKTC